MVFNRLTTCCFSGYRPEKFSFDFSPGTTEYAEMEQAVLHALKTVVADGYNTFLCGMAQGFDLLCGSLVGQLRRENPGHAGIRLAAVVPYEGFSDNWTKEWQDTYDGVYDDADEIIYTSARYFRGCFNIRNRFLVDNASRLICFWDGKLGGTAYTVKYAHKQGLRVINLGEK